MVGVEEEEEEGWGGVGGPWTSLLLNQQSV